MAGGMHSACHQGGAGPPAAPPLLWRCTRHPMAEGPWHSMPPPVYTSSVVMGCESGQWQWQGSGPLGAVHKIPIWGLGCEDTSPPNCGMAQAVSTECCPGMMPSSYYNL